MRIISIEDIRDVYIKIQQRGLPFLFTKLSPSKEKRTKSSFNYADLETSYWSMIPKVNKRLNKLITGSESVEYEEYLSKKLTTPEVEIKMLSIGCGIASHELKLAKLNPKWNIVCVDFSEKLLQEAMQVAEKQKLTNITFINKNIYSYNISENEYDIIFFHQSLHHFKNMDIFLQKIKNALKVSGKLVINEYVGTKKMLYAKSQLVAINEALKLLDEKHRVIYKTNLKKNRYYGSGLLRMLISDPSECVESDRILPIIHRLFITIEEKGYGGNLLMPLLKDLAQHFIISTKENEELLNELFAKEDDYLQNNQSDFVFGIYEKVIEN